jgi:uncharacterized protein YndB with AHSA1/START domain
MSYDLKTEKVIARPVSDVFAALKEGLLFMNCGSDSAATKIDFRVGGKYDISFKNKTLKNFGEFLEIVPDKRIVFNWCQSFGEGQTPDTTVTIDLFPEGAGTKVVLQHTGFNTEELKAGHTFGWEGDLNDLGQELEVGRLRFLRTYELAVEKLFALCKTPTTFADFKLVEATPSKKIVLSNHATLNFTQKENGTSTIEILQDGLATREARKTQRLSWENAIRRMTELVAKEA